MDGFRGGAKLGKEKCLEETGEEHDFLPTRLIFVKKRIMLISGTEKLYFLAKDLTF